jgi:hypothetical protein
MLDIMEELAALAAVTAFCGCILVWALILS